MPFNARCLFILFLLLCASAAHGQVNYSVKGTVTDSISAPLAGATVRIVLGTDTIKAASNDKGEFKINNIQQTEFGLKISYLGYIDLQKQITVTSPGEEFTIPAIILKADTNNLNEVVVKSGVRPIVLKKDTIEYNLGAFRGSDKEMIQQLLKRLPGLRIDNEGNLTSGGKPVTRLRVNGRDFFTGNVKDFIKQLPAGIFTKAQIVNDYGRMADFTGVKKESSQMLNLVTEPGMDNGLFGTLSASAGTNRQRRGGINANYWLSHRQISGEGDISTANNTVGSTKSKHMGFNYGDNLSKTLNLNTSYQYSNNQNGSQNSSYSESINAIGQINNAVNDISLGRSNSHSFGLNLSNNPNKKVYVAFGFNWGLSKRRDSSMSNAQQTGVIKQDLITHNQNNSTSPNTDMHLSLGRELNDKHRITGNIQYRQNNASSTERIDRNIRYYDTLGNFKKDSIFNSLVNNTSNSRSLTAGITYSAKLGEKSNLDVVYNFNENREKNALETEQIHLLYGLSRIDSLSSRYQNKMSTNYLNLSYRWEDAKINYTTGINAQRNSQSGLYAGRAEKVSISNYNLSPVLNFSYTPSAKYQYSLGYNGSSQSPTIDQLQPVRDTRNLQNVIIGNPGLKTAFTHGINGNWRFNPKDEHLISLDFNASLIQNQIITNTIIVKDTLNSLKQVTTFLNAGGSNNIGGGYTWNIPIKLGEKKLNAEFHGDVNFQRQLVYTDNIKSYNNSRNISQSVRGMVNLKKFSGSVNIHYGQAANHYVVGQGLSSRVSTFSLSTDSQWSFSEYGSLSMNISKSFIYGYANIGTNNPLLVNALANQLFFKQRLNIGLQVSDLFNQANRVQQQVSGNSIINFRNNYITRFITFNCSYSISEFGLFKK